MPSLRTPMRAAVLASVAALSTGTGAAVAQTYPTKQITIVAASAPGGAVDILSRITAKYMEQTWGKPVVVVNKAGAGGAVAAAQVKNDAPDGHTLIVSQGNTFTSTWQQMDNPTYNVDDFTYIQSFTGGGCAWVAKADGPYKTLKDLLAAAKSGKSVTFGAFSNDNKIFVDYVAKKDGVQIKSVTMKSVPEVLQAVMGGHVDFGFSGGSHAQYVRKGLLRVVASTDIKRVADSPDVPTLKEMGYGVTSCAFFMIGAPKGLPKNLTDTIADAVAKAMGTDEAKKFLEGRDTQAVLFGPEEMTKILKEEASVYLQTIKALN